VLKDKEISKQQSQHEAHFKIQIMNQTVKLKIMIFGYS